MQNTYYIRSSLMKVFKQNVGQFAVRLNLINDLLSHLAKPHDVVGTFPTQS